MPQTPYSPDPSLTLNDLLNTPAAGPDSTPEMDRYYDQPRRDALFHALATGQAPATESVVPRGPIGAIAQRLGLMPTTQALPQSVADQISIAQGLRTRDITQEALRQRLATLQAVQPGVIQLGPEYGQAAAKSLGEPDLAGAFPSTLKGRGQVGLEESQMRTDVQSRLADIKDALAANQIDRANAMLENLQAKTALAEQAQSIREAGLGIEQSKFGLEQEKFQDAPKQRAQEMHLQSLDRQEQSIYGELSRLSDPLSGAPLPDTDPRVSRLEQRLNDIQNERDSLYGTLTGASSANPAAAKKKPAPAASSGTPAAKTSKIPGLFGD